ncbi:hypothetical protein EPA93_39690 [Ktedonosporobacter rubrisoli]|uniref:Uncharacterized protein n=1 Tax=Ktedonosporobacter rubrisoli TaxID=2509675 RepID=A0A4P6K1P3_KTERU|nr:hypothetical protein [Ktedonosporobacter rubrisoli]QBD81772.1 hypothetical protein EPA93_39690 [Ktedonosporobacter rubrisoli]
MSRYLHFSPHTLHFLKHVQAQLDQLDPGAAPRAFVTPGSPQPREDIIIFAGSFNPPTIAHIALLKQARQYARAHEPMHLYAAFNKLTVDKENVERPLLLERILLLQNVLRPRLPHAGILLFNRGLYVEQAEAIRHSFPQVKRIFFLMGFDKIVQIFDPHYYEDRDAALADLFKQAQMLVAPRGSAGKQELEDLLNQPQNRKFAGYVQALPFSPTYRAIASSHIRQHSANYLHDVPQEVRQFMRETRAYAPPLHRSDGVEIDYYGERAMRLERQVHQRQALKREGER